MKLLLIVALLFNIIITACEIWALKGLRRKVDILKYYTFFQNAFALVVSIVFSIYLLMSIIGNLAIPEYIKGLRYTATTGLLTAMFVYFVILAPSGKEENLLTENDFLAGYSHRKENFILHILCPMVSLLSFVCFERQITLSSSEWTGYVAIPSCLYGLIYLFLSLTHLWKEPYNFTQSKNKKKQPLLIVLNIATIPISFILISFVLWNIQ